MTRTEWIRCLLLTIALCIVASYANPARSFSLVEADKIRGLARDEIFWDQRLRRGEFWIMSTWDTTDRGPEITDAQFACETGWGIPKCNVRLGAGPFWANQITMQQWGGSLIGLGTNRTIIHQYLNGVNTDLIRQKKVGGLTGDASQHWFDIGNFRLRKGQFGDPQTSDTKGSGLNFCVGEQGETSRVRDILVSGFPDYGIRYGCADDYYGPGDPSSPVGNNNGGFVPGLLSNVASFGNGLSGFFLDRERLVVSRFTAFALSGDGNGWRRGWGALVEIDGGCGGGNACGEQITLDGIKSEVGATQIYAVLTRQMIGELVVVKNVSHRNNGASEEEPEGYAIKVTDDTPGAAPYGGGRVRVIGVGGLFLEGYLIDDSRDYVIERDSHHTQQDFLHDPWTSHAEGHYCASQWPDGYDHVAGPNTQNPGHPCTCYQGQSVKRDDYAQLCAVP